ncbi:MAG TPA: hypothetical protein VJ481_03130 [Patescibacteria group bacterium]|nr:hypothetical protein [Patescibacteria group bacterium]
MNAVKKVFVVVLAFSIVSLSCSLTPQVQGEPTPSQTAAPARQAETTDSSGRATFEDPSSAEEVVVTILDGGEELQGAEVAYFHGQTNPFEVYLVRDARGLLAMEFYLHNSEHTIEVTRGEIRPLNPEQVEATEGYLTDMGLVSRNTYLETIPNAELQTRMAQLQVAGDVMLFFIGTFWEVGRAAKAFLGAIGDAIGILPEPEDPNIQWDLYESYDAEWGYTSLVFVESQPPLMQSPTVDVGEDGSVTVSLLGIDPTRYPTTSTQFAGMPDQTIFEGPTEFSDLVYFYGVETEDGTTVIANEVRQNSVCIQGTCTRTELDLGILPTDKYYLTYQALDEVGNFSLLMELGVEVGTAAIPTFEPDVGLDPLQTLRAVSIMVQYRDFGRIPQLVTDEGVAITGYLYEWRQPEYDNSDEVIAFLEEATRGQTPQCYTMILGEGTYSGRATVVFSGVNLVPEFGEYASDSLLVVDMRNYTGYGSQAQSSFWHIVAIGPFSEAEIGSIPGTPVGCSGENPTFNPNDDGMDPRAQYQLDDFEDFVWMTEMALKERDQSLLRLLLYDPIIVWGCVSEGCGIGPIERHPDEEVVAFFRGAEFFGFGRVEASEGDTSFFPDTPIYADHTIIVETDYTFLYLGFDFLGDRYYITDIWWPIQ